MSLKDAEAKYSRGSGRRNVREQRECPRNVAASRHLSDTGASSRAVGCSLAIQVRASLSSAQGILGVAYRGVGNSQHLEADAYVAREDRSSRRRVSGGGIGRDAVLSCQPSPLFLFVADDHAKGIFTCRLPGGGRGSGGRIRGGGRADVSWRGAEGLFCARGVGFCARAAVGDGSGQRGGAAAALQALTVQTVDLLCVVLLLLQAREALLEFLHAVLAGGVGGAGGFGLLAQQALQRLVGGLVGLDVRAACVVAHVVALAAGLHGVVAAVRVGAERYRAVAARAADAQAVDLDGVQVPLRQQLLLAVELAELGDVLRALEAAHAERRHQADADGVAVHGLELLGELPDLALGLLGVVVRRVVLVDGLSLRHRTGRSQRGGGSGEELPRCAIWRASRTRRHVMVVDQLILQIFALCVLLTVGI